MFINKYTCLYGEERGGGGVNKTKRKKQTTDFYKITNFCNDAAFCCV